jgi:hypothetical protein
MIKHIFLISLLGIGGCSGDWINHPDQDAITRYKLIDYYAGLQSASHGCFIDTLHKIDRGYCPMYYSNKSKMDEMNAYYDIYRDEMKEFQHVKLKNNIKNAKHYEKMINEQLIKNAGIE